MRSTDVDRGGALSDGLAATAAQIREWGTFRDGVSPLGASPISIHDVQISIHALAISINDMPSSIHAAVAW